MLISKRLDTLITEESSEMKVDNSARICLKRQSFLNNFDSSSWTKCNNDNRSITKWGSKIVNLNNLSEKFLMKILAKSWRFSRKLRHSVWKSPKNVSFSILLEFETLIPPKCFENWGANFENSFEMFSNETILSDFQTLCSKGRILQSHRVFDVK